MLCLHPDIKFSFTGKHFKASSDFMTLKQGVLQPLLPYFFNLWGLVASSSLSSFSFSSPSSFPFLHLLLTITPSKRALSYHFFKPPGEICPERVHYRRASSTIKLKLKVGILKPLPSREGYLISGRALVKLSCTTSLRSRAFSLWFYHVCGLEFSSQTSAWSIYFTSLSDREKNYSSLFCLSNFPPALAHFSTFLFLPSLLSSFF